jgi:hypothetical protein
MVEIVLVQDNTPEAYARPVHDLEHAESCGKSRKLLNTLHHVLLTSKPCHLPYERVFLTNPGQTSKNNSLRQAFTKRQLNSADSYGSCRTSSSNAT